MALNKKTKKSDKEKATEAYAKKSPGQGTVDSDENSVIGPNLNFTASEAYKMLRTNLMFSFADSSSCHIVGVTSAIKSEGKSTTSLNAAYSIAESGKKCLLIEGDMRLPTLSKKCGCNRTPGLSNVLTDQCDLEDALQRSKLNNNLFLLTAGDIPPNPSELLGSDKMRFVLDVVKQVFDTVIIDLTPVTIVADASIVGKMCDGVVMVVAEDYCTKRILKEAINQLSLADVKILGFVMTRSNAGKKKYYYKKYYKRNRYNNYYNNYYNYYGGYGYGTEPTIDEKGQKIEKEDKKAGKKTKREKTKEKYGEGN